MPRPQSVKAFSNDSRSSRNFGVTFSKTPCFPASNRQGSRQLRPAKAVAFPGFATQRRTEAEHYETYEFALVEAMKGYWSSEIAAAATLDRATLGATSTYAASLNGTSATFNTTLLNATGDFARAALEAAGLRAGNDAVVTAEYRDGVMGDWFTTLEASLAGDSAKAAFQRLNVTAAKNYFDAESTNLATTTEALLAASLGSSQATLGANLDLNGETLAALSSYATSYNGGATGIESSAIGTYEGLSQSEIDARCEYYKAVATADKVERVKQIDIELARTTAMYAYYVRWATMTAIGQNGLGWNLAASVGDYCVQNLLSYGLGRVGEWQFDDYVQKDGLWVMHGYYSRVHDYYEPITYWAGNSYFGGYSNMHGCSDESCGDAYHRQILYDFYKPTDTLTALYGTLACESELAKEQRTADIATAFAKYNAKYCDLYYDSEEATWGFEEQYLELDIATYTRYHDDLWSAYETCNGKLIAADRADNSLDVMIGSVKSSVANMVTYNNAMARSLGRLQIDSREDSDHSSPGARYPSGAAHTLDITWAGNVATAREAYVSSLGDAYKTLAFTSLDALKDYGTTTLEASIGKFESDFANENTYSDALLDAKSEHARDTFDADKTKALAVVENDITKRKGETDYEAELARELVTKLKPLVGPDFNAFTTKQNAWRSENYQKLADKKSELSAAETAANKAAEAARFQAIRAANTTYNNACGAAALARAAEAKAIDAAYRDAMNAATDVYDTAIAVANATYGNAISMLASRWQSGLQTIADGGSVSGTLFAQTGNGSGPIPKQSGGATDGNAQKPPENQGFWSGILDSTKNAVDKSVEGLKRGLDAGLNKVKTGYERVTDKHFKKRVELNKNEELDTILKENGKFGKPSLKDRADGGEKIIEEAFGEKWTLLKSWESVLHSPNRSGKDAMKWVSESGREVVILFDDQGLPYVTKDPAYIGTYNYANPTGLKGKIDHLILDVAPHYLLIDPSVFDSKEEPPR